jgi:hypothetical protein
LLQRTRAPQLPIPCRVSGPHGLTDLELGAGEPPPRSQTAPVAREDKTTAPIATDEFLKHRADHIMEANMLLGIEEQMVRLQRPEVFANPKVAKLMKRMSHSLTMTDAVQTSKLLPFGGNWADFGTRMGLKEVPVGTKADKF